MRYEPCTLSDLTSFGSYLDSLSSPIDSFLEDYILDSQFYRILVDHREVGSFAVHRNCLLTQFHMVGLTRRWGQRVFAEILAEFGITSAFVPTCDEFFLSHALDDCADIKKQAYFFIDGGAVEPPPIAADLQYRPANPADAAQIELISGDFLDRLEEGIADGQLHVGYLNGEMVAIGVVVRGKILLQYASIGMFTKDTYRRRGVGTATIWHLKGHCRDAGLAPISGCWYYNDNSKRTLEAAGMLAITRLLRFEFGDSP